MALINSAESGIIRKLPDSLFPDATCFDDESNADPHPTGAKMQVFMSYSRKNKGAAGILAQDIQDLGHSLWQDQEISGGRTWWDEILSRIRKCEVFVFVLSEDALESEPCRREYTYAAQLGKRILPVLAADGVSANLLPPELSKIQFVDYRLHDKAALFALNKSFQNLPPQRPLPDPLPKPPDVPIAYLSGIREKLVAGLPQDFNGQIALVYDLKGHLSSEDEYDDARKLLEDIRGDPGLLARVASEIDGILAEAAKPPIKSLHQSKTTTLAYSAPPSSKPGSAGGAPGSAVPAKKGGALRLVKVSVGVVVGLSGLLMLWSGSQEPDVALLVIGGVVLLSAFLIIGKSK